MGQRGQLISRISSSGASSLEDVSALILLTNDYIKALEDMRLILVQMRDFATGESISLFVQQIYVIDCILLAEREVLKSYLLPSPGAKESAILANEKSRAANEELMAVLADSKSDLGDHEQGDLE